MLGEEAMRDYSKDEELLQLKEAAKKRTLTGEKANRFVVLCRALYYILDIDENLRIRLYIPRGPLQEQALEGYHQKLEHLGTKKNV